MKMCETSIVLLDDYQGKAQATLVEMPATESSTRAVLYIHGYIDYFFQYHMAEQFNVSGFNFYAVDLRKYGRSILRGQRPYYCRSVSEYYPEIDAAIDIICTRGNSDITLLGHSTGGLLSSLYCTQGTKRQYINRLILNSPFFEFNTYWFKRRIAIPLSGIVSRLFPYAHKTNELSPHYFSSVHSSEHGEWDFDQRLKPKDGVPLYFAWLGAIFWAQHRLRKGLSISIPILVMHSTHSWWGKQWDKQATASDSVLNVRHIVKYAPRLGKNVTLQSIDDGLHDLVLSKKEVRERVLADMIGWINSESSKK